MKTPLTVTFVDYKTPFLARVLIDSFLKFSEGIFELKFVVVENSSLDLTACLESINTRHIKDDAEIKVINRETSSTFSFAHAEGLEASKDRVDTGYVFTCHSDVFVTSQEFFKQLCWCIENNVVLAGVCQDRHPARVGALHCSGLLVRSDVYKTVEMSPTFPEIDTADKLTLHCRDNGLRMHLFKNTYNDPSLVDTIDSPYKELGKTCGVDRCVGPSGRVMYMHQGRGTSKYEGNKSDGKLSTEKWLDMCWSLLER